MIIIKEITNLNQLDKSLDKYDIAENDQLKGYEKEMYLNFTNEGVKFHSDKRTGIKWGIQILENYDVELIRLYIKNNKIVHIDLIIPTNFFTFKATPRGSDGISNMFSMPESYNNSDFIQKKTS